MHSQKTKRIALSSLKEGDVVWSDHYECYLIFQEESEFEGGMYFWFKRFNGDSYVLLKQTEVHEVSDLIKELL